MHSREAGSLVPPLRLSGVAVICCLLTIFAVAVKPVTDPDFWWHLATGRYMVDTHSIPHHDVFSLTARGHVWITHEWATELLFYFGWTHGGMRLLMLATACVITLTFAIVYLAARERGVPAFLNAAMVLLAALASAHTWGTRPQMLSLLLTALFGWGIGRMVIRRQSAPPLWMPLVMVAWVNIHGGFIFGLALMAMATGAYMVASWASQSTALGPETSDLTMVPAASRPAVDTRRCAIVVGLTALATLINPNGLAGALYPFSYLGNNASTRYIAEWVSPDFHKPQYLLFEALVLLLIVGGLAGAQRARLVDAVILLPFLYLAFDSVRNISLFAVLGAPITAELLVLTIPKSWRSARPRRPVPEGKAIVNWLAVLIIGSGVTGSWLGKLSDSSQARAVAAIYPVGALQYARTHQLPVRGFDSYNWGGFLIWNWFPNRYVFVDGRPDMYGDTFMDHYMRAYDGETSWRSLLTANRLCYALVEPSSGIAGVLGRDRSWALAYHDKVSDLFVLTGHPYSCS